LEIEIFQGLCKRVLEKDNLITKTSLSLSSFDVYSSIALISNEKNFIRPILNSSLKFNIVNGRHLIVESSQNKTGTQFSSNNCVMDLNKNRILLVFLTLIIR
jgi:DNA mismatch repair protein MutS